MSNDYDVVDDDDEDSGMNKTVKYSFICIFIFIFLIFIVLILFRGQGTINPEVQTDIDIENNTIVDISYDDSSNSTVFSGITQMTDDVILGSVDPINLYTAITDNTNNIDKNTDSLNDVINDDGTINLEASISEPFLNSEAGELTVTVTETCSLGDTVTDTCVFATSDEDGTDGDGNVIPTTSVSMSGNLICDTIKITSPIFPRWSTGWMDVAVSDLLTINSSVLTGVSDFSYEFPVKMAMYLWVNGDSTASEPTMNSDEENLVLDLSNYFYNTDYDNGLSITLTGPTEILIKVGNNTITSYANYNPDDSSGIEYQTCKTGKLRVYVY